MEGPKNYQPLCGVSLEKPISTILPIYDAFIGLSGLGLLVYTVYGYHKIDLDRIPSSRKSQLDNFQTVKWTIQAASSSSLFLLAVLLRKGALSRNVTLLNLWVVLTFSHAAVITAFCFTSLFFFLETFDLRTTSVVLLYHAIKVYFCHVVRYYALQLMHEQKMSSAVRPLTEDEISDFENGTPSLSQRSETQENIQHVVQKSGYSQHSEIESSRFELENVPPDNHSQATSSPDDLYKLAQFNGYQKHFEIDMSRLEISWSVALGSGEFGVVYKGVVRFNFSRALRLTHFIIFHPQSLTGVLSEDTLLTETVAVKVINPEATDVCGFKLMLSELKVMTYIGEHPNVVRFIGANTSQIMHRKLFIILEFCGLGSLLQVLKGSRGLFVNLVQDGNLLCSSEETGNLLSSDSEIISTLNLLQWSHQIARGMEFLASKRLVHGDLACRNVLLTDQKVAKITDFGLSRRLYDCSVYCNKNSQKQIPWMNVSLESIVDHQFSTHSDVWSYGITLWEMFSLGEVPYPEHSFGVQFIRELRNGMRPTNPSRAPNFICDLMQLCWIKDVQKRPNFLRIQEVLSSC